MWIREEKIESYFVLVLGHSFDIGAKERERKKEKLKERATEGEKECVGDSDYVCMCVRWSSVKEWDR